MVKFPLCSNLNNNICEKIKKKLSKYEEEKKGGMELRVKKKCKYEAV